MTVDEIIAEVGDHAINPNVDEWWSFPAVAALVAEIERLRANEATMRSTIKDMNQHIKTLEDDQIAREREAEWQPIQSALDQPRHRVPILTYDQNEETLCKYTISRWISGDGEFMCCASDWPVYPTHWRLLPPPPKGEGNEQNA